MKLASIEYIKDIKPHNNADKLELATVLGWQSVVKKGEYKVGDKIVFINIDTIVPRCAWSEFLADKDNPDKPIRIKNIKLRGEYSSGLIVSINSMPAFMQELDAGNDVSEALGIQKYIKELPANLSGENVGEFPSHIISKTDEDNGLSDLPLVNQVLDFDSITVTRKLDGSSITIIVEDGVITQVCSRNLSKKDTGKSLFWNAAKKFNIPPNWTGAIQGELMGNGIQKNQLKLEGHDIYVFQIMVNENGNRRYMSYHEMCEFCKNVLKADFVKLVGVYSKEEVSKWANPLQHLQDLADKQKLSNGANAEGIVVRPSNYVRSFSSRRPLGFKLINRNYNDT
jgi:RNA ligase (TIGR02306 family)